MDSDMAGKNLHEKASHGRKKFVEGVLDGRRVRLSYTDVDNYMEIARGQTSYRKNTLCWSDDQLLGIKPPPKKRTEQVRQNIRDHSKAKTSGEKAKEVSKKELQRLINRFTLGRN